MITIKTFLIYEDFKVEEIEDSTARTVMNSIIKNLCIPYSLYVNKMFIVKIEECTGEEKEQIESMEILLDSFDSLEGTIICADSILFKSHISNAEDINKMNRSVLSRFRFESIGEDVMVYRYTDIGGKLLCEID